MSLYKNVKKFIYEKYKGKAISIDKAKTYCPSINFNSDDYVLIITEQYISKKDLLAIFQLDEEQYPKRVFKKLPRNSSTTKTLLFIESKDNCTISNIFIHDPFNLGDDILCDMFDSLRTKFG